MFTEIVRFLAKNERFEDRKITVYEGDIQTQEDGLHEYVDILYFLDIYGNSFRRNPNWLWPYDPESIEIYDICISRRGLEYEMRESLAARFDPNGHKYSVVRPFHKNEDRSVWDWGKCVDIRHIRRGMCATIVLPAGLDQCQKEAIMIESLDKEIGILQNWLGRASRQIKDPVNTTRAGNRR